MAMHRHLLSGGYDVGLLGRDQPRVDQDETATQPERTLSRACQARCGLGTRARPWIDAADA
jgi:hypothetical protein